MPRSGEGGRLRAELPSQSHPDTVPLRATAGRPYNRSRPWVQGRPAVALNDAAYTPLYIDGDGKILTQNNGHLFVVGNDD